MSNAREKLGWMFVVAGLAILAGGLVFDVMWGIVGTLPFAVGYWWLFKSIMEVSVSTSAIRTVPSSPEPTKPEPEEEVRGHEPSKEVVQDPEDFSLDTYHDPNEDTWLYKIVASRGVYYGLFFPAVQLWRETPGLFVGAGLFSVFSILLTYAASHSPTDVAQDPYLRIIEKIILGFVLFFSLYAVVVCVKNAPRYWRRFRRQLRPTPEHFDGTDDQSAA